MSHPLPVRRDVDFLLHRWLQVETLFAHPRYSGHDRETVDGLLDLSEVLARELFLTHYKASDIHEPSLTQTGVHVLPAIGQALSKYAEVGLFSAGFPTHLGGMGLPHVLCAASYAYFAAANIATVAYPMLTIANARLLTTFGSQCQIDKFARPQIEGRWFGTMCLSEPQAGSSLADVRTRAQPDSTDDDLGSRYRLYGNKMWISGGDQDISENIVHLVLAKVPLENGALPAGSASISLFIVPKILPDGRPNDIRVAGLNHKMGYRGTSNCLLNFGEKDGAIGWMVGAPGQGLRQMFMMMNEARIAVGLGAAALGYRSYRHAVQYATERLQGRSPGQRGGDQLPIIHHPDIKRLLLTQKAYVEGALALCLYCAKLVDEPDDPDSAALLALLTPVAKTWPSEYGLAANDIAIQIHGGYGYTRDFDVEQLYRDNRLNPIHEGTTGIQALDLVGRKIVRDSSGLTVLRKRLSDTIRRSAQDADLSTQGRELNALWSRIESCVVSLRESPSWADNATAFLSSFGHAVAAWLWLDQTLAARHLPDDDPSTQPFIAGKLQACRFFFATEVPRAHAWLAFLESHSSVVTEASIEIF